MSTTLRETLSPATQVTDHAPVIALRDAAAVVGGKSVWSQVTMQVNPGEFIGVLGPNGSGKSTLLKALIGLTPATGDLEVLGQRPGRTSRQVGYVPQRRSYDTSLRVRGIDVVGLGFDGARWGIPLPGVSRLVAPRRAAVRRARIEEAIDLVGASAYAQRPIGACSGGEQQRLLIAQALVRNPRLLLLDEPLDSLDVPSQAGISALVRSVCRDHGVAVMMVAHDVNPILPYLDRVVYIARGTAVIGTPDGVITAEALTALYGIAIEVLRDSTGRLIVVGQPDVPPTHDPRGPV
jgi:zinc/manganese transport system ATP-binding protein